MASAIINVMSQAAIKASRGLLRDFGEIDKLQVSKKGASDFFTASDIRCEKSLMQELKKAKPEYGFLSEEAGEIKGKDESHRWILDPIDGTSNFIHALPYFCISMALEKCLPDGRREVIAGVIYDPVHNELFHAERGKGAFLNDYRIQVSRRESFELALLASSHLRQKVAKSDETFARFDRLTHCGAIVRYLGASALDLAYVAAGRIDLAWHAGIKPWDIAAGILLVQEAGGVALDEHGNPATTYSNTLLTVNRGLQAKAVELLTGP